MNNETEFANQDESKETEATEAVRPVTDDFNVPPEEPTPRYDWKYVAFYGLNVALDEVTHEMDRLLCHVGFKADNETIMNSMHALEGSLHTAERMLANLMGMCPQLMRDEDEEEKK